MIDGNVKNTSLVKDSLQRRVLSVIPMGHPILRQKCNSVENPLDSEIQALLRDMEATVEFLNCSGLAAPQVLVPLRIVIFRVMTTTTNPAYQLTPEYDPEGVPWTIMMNPKITPLSEDITMGWESCLSLPGLMGKVPRYHAIQYTYLNRHGQEETRIARGFHARVVQHECDHLEGILYPQRIVDLTDFGFKDTLLKEALSEKKE